MPVPEISVSFPASFPISLGSDAVLVEDRVIVRTVLNSALVKIVAVGIDTQTTASELLIEELLEPVVHSRRFPLVFTVLLSEESHTLVSMLGNHIAQ